QDADDDNGRQDRQEAQDDRRNRGPTPVADPVRRPEAVGGKGPDRRSSPQADALVATVAEVVDAAGAGRTGGLAHRGSPAVGGEGIPASGSGPSRNRSSRR